MTISTTRTAGSSALTWASSHSTLRAARQQRGYRCPTRCRPACCRRQPSTSAARAIRERPPPAIEAARFEAGRQLMIAERRIDPQMPVAPDLGLRAVHLVVGGDAAKRQVAVDENGRRILGGDLRDQRAACGRRTGCRFAVCRESRVAVGNQHQRIGQRGVRDLKGGCAAAGAPQNRPHKYKTTGKDVRIARCYGPGGLQTMKFFICLRCCAFPLLGAAASGAERKRALAAARASTSTSFATTGASRIFTGNPTRTPYSA